MTKHILLIVDDDESIRSQMRAFLKDYEIYEAGDHETALEITKKFTACCCTRSWTSPKPRGQKKV